MANEQQQTQPQVAIPLPKGKKNAVQIGCICMMLSVAMYGLVFATLNLQFWRVLTQWDMYPCSLFLPEWEYPL